MSKEQKPIFVNARDARPLSSFSNHAQVTPQKEVQPDPKPSRPAGESPFVRLPG